MAEFRETVLTFWSVLPVMATIYFWVVGMRVLSAAAANPRDSCSTSPTPSPSPAMDICSPEFLNGNIDTSLRWMAITFGSAVWLIYLIKRFVDSAAAAETKGDTLKEETYKFRCDELKESIKVVENALENESTPDFLEAYVTAIGRRNVAMGKAAKAKPKEGLARFPRRKQIQVRIVFLLAVVFSFASGCFAAAAFHFSLQLRAGCETGPGPREIAGFAIVGFIFSVGHVVTAIVGCIRD